MEFKDLPVPFQEMASNVVRSQLATLDLSTVEKETIDNISGNVRRAFIGLYEEKQLSDNQDLHEKYFPDLMDIIDKGFGLLMKKKGIRIEPLKITLQQKALILLIQNKRINYRLNMLFLMIEALMIESAGLKRVDIINKTLSYDFIFIHNRCKK